MVHKAKGPEPVQDPSPLKSVLVICGDVIDHPSKSDVQQYMGTREESGGGLVERVTKLDNFTYVLHFHDQSDTVNVVRRGDHSIEGFPAYVFLFDEQNSSVYSGHQTVSCQDTETKQVLIHGYIFTLGKLTAEDVKAHMESQGNAGCRVVNVQCPNGAGIAIVEFQHSEDVIRVAEELVTMSVGDATWPVTVFPLRPLPSDLADIPTDTASRDPVEQTLALERRQVPAAPVTSPHDSQTMPAGTSRAEGKIQKEKKRVQGETEDLRLDDHTERMSSMQDKWDKVFRLKGQTEAVCHSQDQQELPWHMEDWLENLRRTNAQSDAQVKAQVDARARVQSDVSRLEARLQREVAPPDSRVKSIVRHLERSSVTSMEDEVSQSRSHDNQTTFDLGQSRDELGQTRNRLNASDSRIQMLTTENIQLRAELEKLKRQLHVSHQISSTVKEVASKHMQDKFWWNEKLSYEY